MTIGKAAFPLLFCRKAEQTDRRPFFCGTIDNDLRIRYTDRSYVSDFV